MLFRSRTHKLELHHYKKCNQCEFIASIPVKVDVHVQDYHDKKKIKCEYCGVAVKRNKMADHHNVCDYRHECICGKYISLIDFNKHKEMHMEQCEIILKKITYRRAEKYIEYYYKLINMTT